MKIAHIADIHIRNLKYHQNYRECFSDLYSKLDKACPDYICLVGDLAHTKVQISPEYVQLATEFLDSLSNIAPLIVVPGNHDGNLKNSTRLDAITPIVKALDKDTIYFSKFSESIEFDDVVFYHYSVFDENWTPPETEKILIGLYHGALNKAQTDKGFELSSNTNIDLFEKSDYLLLGDIHKSNQVMGMSGRARYCGSLICQNFGEDPDKGYLEWDISSPTSYKCNFVNIINKSPFLTIEMNSVNDLQELSGTERLRIMNNSGLTDEEVRQQYDFSSFPYVSIITDAQEQELEKVSSNLHEFAYNEFVKKSDSKDQLQLMVKLDEEISSCVDTPQSNGSKWEVVELGWSNYFNYGENNKINFNSFDGILGIFGESYSGKSSIIEVLLFTIFGKTAKNIRKNQDLINYSKDKASSYVKIKKQGREFLIRRTLERTKNSAKSTIDFSNKEGSLNGSSVYDTQTNIDTEFGSFSDFLITSFSPQFGTNLFIDKTNTERKRSLASFLNLDFYDDKYKVAHSRLQSLSPFYKKYKERSFHEEIKELETKINNLTSEIQTSQLSQASNNKLLEQCQDILSNYNVNPPKKTPDQVSSEIDKKRNLLDLNSEKIHNTTTKIESYQSRIEEAEKEIGGRTREEIVSLIRAVEKQQQDLSEIADKVTYHESEIRKSKELDTSPCLSGYSKCRMALEAKEFLGAFDESFHISEIKNLNSERENINQNDLGDWQELQDVLTLYSALETDQDILKTHNTNLELLNESSKNLKNELNLLEGEYQEIQEWHNNHKNYEDLKVIKEEIEALKQKIIKCESSILSLTEERGLKKGQLEQVRLKQKEFIDISKEVDALQKLKDLYSPNGIPYVIIYHSLDIINHSLDEIITSIAGFSAKIVDIDSKLEIFLDKEDYELPIELGSGAEKTLVSTALRLALIKISMLPKSNLFILDEPANEFDDDLRSKFIESLSMMSSQFSNIILITHLNELKVVADYVFDFSRKDFAHMSFPD